MSAASDASSCAEHWHMSHRPLKAMLPIVMSTSMHASQRSSDWSAMTDPDQDNVIPKLPPHMVKETQAFATASISRYFLLDVQHAEPSQRAAVMYKNLVAFTVHNTSITSHSRYSLVLM
jgi:hypothetical protein